MGPYPYLPALRESGIATYFWSNWHDEPTSQMILAAANIGGKLLVGPGTHCVPPPDYDLGGEIQRFFDHHLKGNDNGIDREPRNTWWVEQAGEGMQWLRSDALPGAAAERQLWQLGDGTLEPTVAVASKQQFTVDYSVGGDDYFAFWVEPQDAHGLTFTSSPLAQPLHLEGYPVVKLRVAADHDDVNVFTYLEEVDASGKVEVLAMGRLAASYRATAAAPYDTLGLPWHPGRVADNRPLVPGEAVDMEMALLPVSRVVAAGHRLRLTVTGADPRQRNLNDIRRDPPPVITLELGNGAAHVSLPVRR